MSENPMNLFEEFEPLSTTDWEEKIKKDLKGAGYEKKLMTKSLNGFKIRPYYREEDIRALPYIDLKPGQYPYIRGNDPKNKVAEVHAEIVVNDIRSANKKAIEYTQKGVTSIGFRFNEKTKSDSKNIVKLLKAVPTAKVYLRFDVKSNLLDFARNLHKTLPNPKEAKGSFNFDPLGNMALIGSCCTNKDCNCSDDLIELLKFCQANLPNFKVVNIHGSHFRNAGSTAVQELAFSMAIGNEYLVTMTEQGFKPEEITKHFMFTFGIGSDYFTEIAKLRAGRLLWSKVVAAYTENQESAKTYFHSETSLWNKTVYDAYVNMLRTTTESMSALLGGTDSMSVMPFDSSFKTSDAFSKRIARNTQIILNEEAKFDQVIDPASGSYYIEYLTHTLAENAWELFKETEAKGGYNKAMAEGFIQENIKTIADERDRRIALGKDAILGTNQFPNSEEFMKEKTEDSIYNNRPKQNKQVEPLTLYRGAQAFEKMRFKTEQADSRPKVFLLTIGNKVMRTARAGFASNFFGTAGFEIINNIGFETIEEGIAEAKKGKADIVTLCSSDNEYSNYVPEAMKQIGNKMIPVIAGYPKDNIETFKTLGIKHFIHAKSDVLNSLKAFQEELGI